MEPTSWRIDVDVADADAADRVSAEAWAAGAAGIEELAGPEAGIRLRIYTAPAAAEALREAVRAGLGAAARVGPAEAVAERDWSQAWREGLDAVVASRRVVVRPSFVEHRPAPGQRVLVVDPGQAFGTGHHASTRLALRLLDDALAGAGDAVACARVLDVGTGSGVLALAAVALGAREAVGFDVDPLAAPEAHANARANGLAPRVHLFTGTLDALGPARFELIAANLIRRELLPLLDGLSARLASGGWLLLSGLLDSDRARVEPELTRRGLTVCSEISEADGADRWVGLVARSQGAAA